MHATAHGGCTDAVRESALKVDSGRKVPCRTGDSNPRQYCARLFNQTFHQVSYPHKLQALVYDTLLPTTAITYYAVCLEKQSANGQFFVGAQTASRFITDDPNYIRCFFHNRPRCLRQQQIKPKSFESRRNSLLTRGGRASCLGACLVAMLLPQSYKSPIH